MTNKKLFHIGSYLALFSLSLAMTTTAYAYGGGGRSQSQSGNCTGVLISNEDPAPKAVIPELSNFSFVVGSNTQVSNLVVKIRDQEGELNVTEQSDGSYLVEGSLPEPITEERYARIDIFAKTNAGCETHHNYLVKIEPQAEEKQASKEESE